MKIVLNIENTQEKFKITIQLNQRLTIGRGEEAKIKINDERISGIHAILEFNSKGLHIYDQKSKNGLLINNIKIYQGHLYLNDKITIGKTILSIDSSESDQEALSLLVYPGQHGTRMTQELKIGQPEIKIKTPEINPLMREILGGNRPRKRMTKEELKKVYSLRSNLSSVIDLLLLIAVAFIPFWVVSESKGVKNPLPVSNGTLVAILEILIVPTFVLINKRRDFTIGEILVGLPSLYDKEND